MRRFRTYHEVEEAAGAEVPAQVHAQAERLASRLRRIAAVWLVGSGKGGVGKSAVSANLAAGLAARGLAVGALDADLNGPSLARMLGAPRGPLAVGDEGVRPARGAAGTRVMSSDLLLEDDSPLRWREPDGHAFVWQSSLEAGMLREFLADTEWGALDALVVDLPPGTDKLARALELVPRPAGVLMVTTPSEAARAVVARSLRMLRDRGVGRVALVANMTGHVCARCGHHEPLFEADGARRLAAASGVEVWAEIPFHAGFARATDAGRPPVLEAGPDGAPLLPLVERVAAASLRDDAAPGDAAPGDAAPDATGRLSRPAPASPDPAPEVP